MFGMTTLGIPMLGMMTFGIQMFGVMTFGIPMNLKAGLPTAIVFPIYLQRK